MFKEGISAQLQLTAECDGWGKLTPSKKFVREGNAAQKGVELSPTAIFSGQGKTKWAANERKWWLVNEEEGVRNQNGWNFMMTTRCQKTNDVLGEGLDHEENYACAQMKANRFHSKEGSCKKENLPMSKMRSCRYAPKKSTIRDGEGFTDSRFSIEKTNSGCETDMEWQERGAIQTCGSVIKRGKKKVTNPNPAGKRWSDWLRRGKKGLIWMVVLPTGTREAWFVESAIRMATWEEVGCGVWPGKRAKTGRAK